MAQVSIHTFYRIWFTWVDPLSLLTTIHWILFDRAFFMNGLIPASMSTADPDHGFLFHGMAALYAYMAITMAVTLRVTTDINVWRSIQGAVLVVDVALLASIYVSLLHQDRLNMNDLRGEDWGAFAYTALVAILRASFLAGVGVKSGTMEAKRD